MNHTQVLIKPSSSMCNLNCRYCFYYDVANKRSIKNSGFMKIETLENIVKKSIENSEKSCGFAFQGGEPTLIGIDFYKKFIELVRKYNTKKLKIFNSIQINGYGLDKEWIDFFKENNFLVGVSLDGNMDTHDYFRKNKKDEGTYERIYENIRNLQDNGVEFNILTVVNSKTAPNIKSIYDNYKKNNFKYLQFIACLDPIEEERGVNEYSLTPEAYGNFLIELFYLWYEDLKKGQQPYIRMFENYIGIVLGMMPESCEQKGQCSNQLVFESNGNAYPCDFYVLDKYCIGNINKDSIAQINENAEKINWSNNNSISDKCRECKYFKLCRGGCKRNKDEDNINYFCESYKMFFDARFKDIRDIAVAIKNTYR